MDRHRHPKRKPAVNRLLLALLMPLAVTGRPAAADAPQKRLTSDQKILIALNRLEFGPRPGDFEAVRGMGLQAWIDQQLAPEKIDDAAVDRKLALLPSLKMSPQEMFDNFRNDQMQIRQRIQADAAKAPNGQPISGPPAAPAPGGQPLAQEAPVVPRPRPYAPTMADGMSMNPQMGRHPPGMRPVQNSIEALGELNDSKLLRACESNRQLQEVLVDFWSNHFNVDVKKGQVRAFKPIEDRDVIRPHVLGRFRELLEASAKSPAMLFYLDNALSTRDFNDPKAAPPMAQRPGALFAPGAFARPGGFAGLANGPLGMQRPGAQMPPGGRRGGGLNENYGRELLELHTLGVDGGYIQKDVQEVARCFTGWTINRQTGAFRFFPYLHDYGEKTVLGHTIPAGGGIKDGETVLDIVAAHPATARHIALKLCQRLVSDTPPKALVDRAAQTFQKSGGDLREVVRSIVTSREFLAPPVYRAKMKSPFEYAVSAIRALGGTFDLPDPSLPQGRFRLVTDGAISMGRGNGGRPGGPFQRVSLVQEIARMGQPMFSHEAPTGYPEDSREWVSSGSLLARFSYAQDLTAGRVAAVSTPLLRLPEGIPAADHKAALKALTHSILGDNVSETTNAAILHEMDGGADPAKVVALILGSPEFQRH